MTDRHPSEAALTQWSTGAARRRVARHAAECPLCLARLEQMTELEPALRSQIRDSLMPEGSMEEALWDRLEARVAEREALSVITELIDVGPATSLLMLGGVEKGEDEA